MNLLEEPPKCVVETTESIHQAVEADLERILSLLRSQIEEKGFSQVGVQKQLGWKGSYLSQLFSRKKALRVAQTLAVLRVVGVEPGEFFASVFDTSDPRTRERERKAAWLHFAREAFEAVYEQYEIKPLQSTKSER